MRLEDEDFLPPLTLISGSMNVSDLLYYYLLLLP